MLFRLATPEDVDELCRLNALFNGPNENTVEYARECLESNPQEVVVVAETEGHLVGFVCVQLKKTFCCSSVLAEIAEVFVEEAYRRKGAARGMLDYAEQHCKQNYPLQRFELLTGRRNTAAQKLYEACGYVADDHLHMKKTGL